MKKQTDNRPPQPTFASVETDLFGALFGCHKKVTTLLREAALGDEKLTVVADRIKMMLEKVTAEIKQGQPLDVRQRLDAAYEEAKRLVDELSHSEDGGSDTKAKPRTRRLKGRKNKP